VQAAAQPQRAPYAAPLYHERDRPEQTTLYRLVQQHAASFIAQPEASTGVELPRFVKDSFGAYLECGIVAHGFLRLRFGPALAGRSRGRLNFQCATQAQGVQDRAHRGGLGPTAAGWLDGLPDPLAL
jgi:hypothetical protein